VSANLHHLVREGDIGAIRAALDRSPEEIHEYDRKGHTPLIVAVQTHEVPAEVVGLLIERGARLGDISRAHHQRGPVLAQAIRAGDPSKVALLLARGADIHYTHEGGHDALLDAAYGANFQDRPRLIELVKLLIASGAALNTESSYQETALGTFSRFGRFDAVKALVDAGADPSRLEWGALHRAVAFGSLEDVQKLVDGGYPNLEERDRRKRTPFLLAVQSGDVEKSEFLLQRGADSRVRAHCDTPALFLAIENHRREVFHWLLRIGADIGQTDEFGATALMTAVEHGNPDAFRALLAAGANMEAQRHGQTALALADRRDMIVQLLDAGADPRQLTHQGQRILIGLGEINDEPLLSVARQDFLADRSRRFGASNPEKMIAPFWEAMIRAGVSGYAGAQVFGGSGGEGPTWCAQRFGQSLTRLPDGRIIQIGGEHEDYYDEDFCIYNDVFVHHPNGVIEIFGYPEDVFPPTDFHSATLIGKYIYVIGSLSYPEFRRAGETQVFRLDTDTLRFEALYPTGSVPGWISHHRAELVSASEIRITGGSIAADGALIPNEREFVLDTKALMWRRT
jgi:ankyrin repeat protein